MESPSDFVGQMTSIQRIDDKKGVKVNSDRKRFCKTKFYSIVVMRKGMQNNCNS